MVCNISAIGNDCVICSMDWMETCQDCHIGLSNTVLSSSHVFSVCETDCMYVQCVYKLYTLH